MTLRLLPSISSDVTLDALYADGMIDFDDGTDAWADPEFADELDRRADALRDHHADDADAVDDHWMLDTHGGGPAIGRDVGGTHLEWVRWSNVH